MTRGQPWCAGLFALLTAVSLHASAAFAGARVEELEFMAGHWTTEGTMNPGRNAQVILETSHADWMDGKFFLVEHTDMDLGAMGKGTELQFSAMTNRKVAAARSTAGRQNAGAVDGDTLDLTSDGHGGMTMKGRFTMKVLSPTSYTVS
jgi:hypothetical protein